MSNKVKLQGTCKTCRSFGWCGKLNAGTCAKGKRFLPQDFGLELAVHFIDTCSSWKGN